MGLLYLFISDVNNFICYCGWACRTEINEGRVRIIPLDVLCVQGNDTCVNSVEHYGKLITHLQFQI